jgi:hypothetical protein
VRQQWNAVSERPGVIGERDHFIPVRKIDVMNAVIEHGALPGETERDKFRQLCRLLGAIYHYQYFERLERLRNDYFYFSPDLDASHTQFDAATLERAYTELIETCKTVLDSANFVEIPHDEVHRAHREHALVPVEVAAPLDQYREVRFYRRGHHREAIEIPQWFGWRKRHVEIDVYDDVVLLVAMKPADAAPGAKRRRARKIKVRPGAVLLKCFRDIARSDLDMLFPDVRVVMSFRDRLWLGVPALIGGIPILIKLASTVTVLLLVAGFYLGLAGSAEEADTAGALAALGGLVALGGFVVQQWIRFQRQSLLYQKTLSDNVYFRNINNNAGIFDYIIGEAEEQECKEAFLAYYFLLAPGDGPTAAALDQRIEAWLRQRFDTDIDFEGNDALAKLDRLGLLRRDGDQLSVLPLDAALVRLDQVWDDFFPYAAAPR